MWWKALLSIFLVMSFAAAVECPPGFDWQRMSGVGCVQSDCVAVGGSYGYTQNCLCRDKKACYERVDYTSFDASKCGASCPFSKVVACVDANAKCPNEATTTTTTTSTSTTSQSPAALPNIGGGITLPALSTGGVISTTSTTLTPRNESCLDFGVKPGDFDLTYTDKELRDEFLDFLSEYKKKNRLYSSSNKYAGWAPSDFAAMGLFMFTKDIDANRKSSFWTGNEDALGKAITDRYQNQGKALTPSEVFEESLKLNGNNMFDALLCSHNYMKSEVYHARDTRTDARMEIAKDTATLADLEKKLKEAAAETGHLSSEGEVMEGMYMGEKYDKLLQQYSTVSERIDASKKRLDNAAASFNRLEKLRGSDNEGAWYHMFGTLTTGYAERENTWRWFGDSAYTRIELWGEHRVYRGLFQLQGSDIDKAEYCWDVWGGYLGGELYSRAGAQSRVRVALESRPPSMLDRPDLGFVRDAYTGRPIYK